MSEDSERLLKEVREAQALALIAILAAYRPKPRRQAWYEKGVIGDLTWPFR